MNFLKILRENFAPVGTVFWGKNFSWTVVGTALVKTGTVVDTVLWGKTGTVVGTVLGESRDRRRYCILREKILAGTVVATVTGTVVVRQYFPHYNRPTPTGPLITPPPHPPAP